MKIILIFLVLAVLVVAVVAAQSKNAKKASRIGTYRQRKIMSDNEEEFFGRLVVALPDHYIFPQVAMSALLDAASSDKKRAHSDRMSIAQKRVDYVVCTRRCEVVAVVNWTTKHTRAQRMNCGTRGSNRQAYGPSASRPVTSQRSTPSGPWFLAPR